MEHHLKELFERELEAEPPMPPGSVAGTAMAAGTRLRRRRTITTAGGTVAAALVVAVTAVSVFGTPMHDEPVTSPVAQMWCPVPERAPYAAREFSAGRDQVAVFLTEDITAAQRTALDELLKADPLVAGTRFESRDAAYQRFAGLWADNPDLLEAVTPSEMPEAFRVRLKDPNTYAAFVDNLRASPGIEDIVGQNPAQCRHTRPGTSR